MTALVFAATPRPVANVLITKPDATKIDLKKYRGKVVLVAFLTTTCENCIHSVDILNRIERDLKPQGFQAVGAIVDDSPRYLVNSFTQRYKPDFPVGFLERDDFIKLADIPKGMRPFVPVFMFVDRKGTVRFQFYGDHAIFKDEEKATRTLVERLLQEQTTAPTK